MNPDFARDLSGGVACHTTYMVLTLINGCQVRNWRASELGVTRREYNMVGALLARR